MKPRTLVTARRVIEKLTDEMGPGEREREIATFRVVIRAVQADYLRLTEGEESRTTLALLASSAVPA